MTKVIYKLNDGTTVNTLLEAKDSGQLYEACFIETHNTYYDDLEEMRNNAQ